MTESPKLSVLIPAYNRPDRLHKALTSYLKSPREDIEYVVVDNGSELGLLELVDGFKDSRLRYRRNRKNIGATRNVFLCLLESKAPISVIMCDDDFCTPGFFDLVIDAFERNPSVAVVHSFDDTKTRLSFTKKFGENGVLIKNGIKALNEIFILSGKLPGLAFRMELIDFNYLKLDNSIYPQVRLASYLAVNHDVFLLTSNKEYKVGNLYATQDIIASISYQNRPLDFGFEERAQIALDTYKMAGAGTRDIYPQFIQLYAWLFKSIFFLMLKESEKMSMSFLLSIAKKSPSRVTSAFLDSVFYFLILNKQLSWSMKFKVLSKLIANYPLSSWLRFFCEIPMKTRLLKAKSLTPKASF